MEIARVDSSDVCAVKTFYEIYRAVGAADAPDTFVASPIDEIIALLAEPTARFEFSALLGYENDRPVASGWAAGFLKENMDHMFVLPRVLPAERRNGHGSTMLNALIVSAREDGRTVLNTQSRWQANFGTSGGGSAAVEFSRKHGFGLGLAEEIRRLDLPRDDRQMSGVVTALRAGSSGYEIRAWLGPVPDELLADWAVMEATVSADAPRGELDLDADVPSPEAVRDDERILAASGQTSASAVALHRNGHVVAYTKMIVQLDAPRPARQSGTLVLAAHRGKGLGLAVKHAVLCLLEQERPDVPATLTQTALDNGHMIGINETLGYVAVEYIGNFEKHL